MRAHMRTRMRARACELNLYYNMRVCARVRLQPSRRIQVASALHNINLMHSRNQQSALRFFRHEMRTRISCRRSPSMHSRTHAHTRARERACACVRARAHVIIINNARACAHTCVYACVRARVH